MIYLFARQAELRGTLDAPTIVGWIDEMDAALADHRRLIAMRDGAMKKCRRCAVAMELLRVKLKEAPDHELIGAAQKAFEAKQLDFAKMYLSAVKDRSHPDLANVFRLPRAARQRRPEP